MQSACRVDASIALFRWALLLNNSFLHNFSPWQVDDIARLCRRLVVFDMDSTLVEGEVHSDCKLR